MDYIYDRAQCVLVWLGSESHSPPFNRPGSGFLEMSTSGRWVCQNNYFTRLWIVQEIGLAKAVKICVGSVTWEWSEVIDCLSCTKSWERNGRFMNNIHIKRNGRHGSSNRLETLLEDFQYTMCEEPRDKIYGFLGLAHDCQDGSIQADYSKPLFELYYDVIRFFCRRRLLRDGSPNDVDRSMRVVRFSQLVQKLLGGLDHLPPFSRSDELVQARGALAGHIVSLGPTFSEMISSSVANKSWKLNFSDHYALPDDIEELRKANEAYGIDLLRMKDKKALEFCCFCPTKSYSRATMAYENWNGDENTWSYLARHTLDDDQRASDPAKIKHPDDCQCQPRMFLGTNRIMGLAPSWARKGDIICQFWKTDVTALLRKEGETETYRVVGRLQLNTGSLRGLEPVYLEWIDPPSGAESVLIQMDIKTLCALTR